MSVGGGFAPPLPSPLATGLRYARQLTLSLALSEPHCVSSVASLWSACLVLVPNSKRGKAVALDRWGGNRNHLSMMHRLTTQFAKNYCNQTLIVQVIVENVVTWFFSVWEQNSELNADNKPVLSAGKNGTLHSLAYVCSLILRFSVILN